MSTYEPPKFRTFQERKREKERLLAIAAGKELESSEGHLNPHQTTESTQIGLAGGTFRLLPQDASSQTVGQESPIVLPPVGVPLAPSIILPNGNGERTNRRPLPTPALGSNRPESAQIATNRSSGPAIQPALASGGSQQYLKHSSTGRRLPKPTPSRSVAIDAIRSSSTPLILEDSTRSPRAPPVANTDYGPNWDRRPDFNADTVTSVKSLDRYGYSSPDPRPLPAPPIGVGPSRSLDIGAQGVSSSFLPSRGGPPGRPPLQNVSEQGSPRKSSVSLDEARVADHSRSKSHEQKQDQAFESSTVEIPILVLPADNLQDGCPPRGEATKPQRPGTNRGYSFSTIPKISVESSAAKEPHDPPAVNVPILAFPDDADSSDGPVIRVDIGNDPHDDARSPNPITQAKSHGPSNISGPGIFCARCDGVIIGRIVTAMDRRWHPECFQCSVCRTLLEHVSSYEHDGHAYCHMDYHDQFAPKCHYCETAIVDSRFITIDDAALGQRYYHELHFFCGECGDPFLDPSKSSAAGNEFNTAIAEGQEQDDLTKEFVIHGKHAFCVECDVKLHKPKCAGCRKPIRDAAVGALGAKWHSECFCCAGCDEPFPTGSFFPIDNEPFCQDCYTATLNMPR